MPRLSKIQTDLTQAVKEPRAREAFFRFRINVGILAVRPGRTLFRDPDWDRSLHPFGFVCQRSGARGAVCCEIYRDCQYIRRSS